ncbi:hypothetical protein TVAG_158930 [Trichomonas vaginalis G3]|uniref:Uncharacterized protein n=1 Tax=Trichomonas vaginalis (strain ATCC PRA-98 / G3) TaxID=412133 RepID=A2E6S2_TRIV3|nr:hypothetical protein TVAGG3_0779240 [Trichomonas vaginalis G3]EAY11666.1 hypothetical protein TVAG_158930 [Trichomonas vaginalis G3]KAI5494929.1 hypothetical protein TVAGG3_0779240 [Trichomonas vaginalis G3]|eukprot:XP_001323889.1 hypothetical protein [Trichomonas vaginalis G3]
MFHNSSMNLNKDIKLSFSIPSILQRDRPTHLQSIVVVNFCFASDLSNDLFLDFGSNIEDVFGQYTSFFMFEKQRFAFYVLFHDDKDLRQPSRDAVAFSLLARDIAKLNKIDVKIAISIEREVTAKAEKIDMIWSVNFPNSILWRTDAMLRYADWGKIACFSKLTSGIHYSKYITLGKFNEQSEIVIL